MKPSSRPERRSRAVERPTVLHRFHPVKPTPPPMPTPSATYPRRSVPLAPVSWMYLQIKAQPKQDQDLGRNHPRKHSFLYVGPDLSRINGRLCALLYGVGGTSHRPAGKEKGRRKPAAFLSKAGEH